MNGLEIKVNRLYKLDNAKGLKAFADIVVNDSLLIKGIRVLDGKNGLFVAMPREQSKDQKWYEKVRCMKPEIKEQIDQVVLQAYHAEESVV